MSENPVTDSDVHVDVDIANAAKDEVGSDDDLMLVTPDEEREEEGRTEGGDINKRFPVGSSGLGMLKAEW